MTLGLTVITFLLSLGISLVLMPPFIKLMEKYKILDKAGGRKIHTGYTAHMGGIVIFISFMLTVCAMLFAYATDIQRPKLLYMGIVLFVMLIVGVRDDMHNISPWTKLFFEILIGIFMSYIGVRLDSLGGFLGIYEIPKWFSFGITTCFFIVVVNAYNLIDGIDGQAGMQAVNVFLFCLLFYVVIVGSHFNNSSVVSPTLMYLSALAILGAITGFLRYNWQKARIFMGDTGSLFIGTLITIFIITSSKYAMLCNVWDGANNSFEHTFFGLHLKATLAPFLTLFYLPMADTLRVFINRARRGKSPFHPDKTHIHHLFIRLGYSHQRCTLTTFTISFCISIIGFVCALLFNDNICIPLIIVSWFLYVKLLHFIVIERFRGGVFNKTTTK
ncbi:MAG: undecaprenyl/decaprenyl-phosphate alpha-N-acetylglucosaminyl 1-phosphate transferase [Bacteroidales bacterium]|nr:undecaprenyl/decaprenyl-phosphate alpha-N-acetylglucosaminyl 1-phosphate transferase [Bacteroidales bacterium]